MSDNQRRRNATTTIEECLKPRDEAEAVADELASLVLDEPVDGAFHEGCHVVQEKQPQPGWVINEFRDIGWRTIGPGGYVIVLNEDYEEFRDYFPDALMAVARCSQIGNDQHNPGEPLHWAKNKSDDHLDCLGRHLLDAGEMDDDGILHDVKVAWRALANLQTVINEGKDVFGREGGAE